MDILVTGGASFVGYYLIKKLLEDKANNIVVTVRPNSKSNAKLEEFAGKIKILEIDMEDLYKLPNYINHVDACFHLAWRGARGKLREEAKLQDDNYIDTMKMVDAIIPLGLKILVGTGSQAEYGIKQEVARESDEIFPNTDYGKIKLKTYQDLKKVCDSHNIALKWGRLYSVYGVGDLESTLFSYCLRQMKENLDVEVGACLQLWNFVNVIDVTNLLASFLSRDIPSGVYNIASEDTRPLKEFVLSMKEALGSKSNIHFGEPSGTPMVLNPSVEKIKKYLPNYKFVNFEQYIASLR